MSRHDHEHREAGKVVGVYRLSMDPGDDFAVLNLLWVSPDRRGRGLGRSLLDEALIFSRRHNREVLALEPTPISYDPSARLEGPPGNGDPSRQDLVGWYLRRGFVPVEDLPGCRYLLTHGLTLALQIRRSA